jgi:hypothetical protein
MAITNTDEFTVYNTFKISGIVTSDTFNSWRKKTNGIINELDRAHDLISNISITNIIPTQLSLGAPTWTTDGALQTYNDGAGSFKAGSIIATSLNVGTGSITAGSFNTTGTLSTFGTLNATSVIAQTINSTNSITSDNSIVATSSIQSNGVLKGKSLDIGSDYAKFTVSDTGVVVGASSITAASLSAGSGTITGGATTITSLAVGNITSTGFVRASGDIVAFNSSDQRLKENIKVIPDALSKVLQLRGVTFDWNDKQTIYSGNDVGVIAQEVEAVLPQIVITRENGYKAVKYERLVALLIESVKELKSEIEQLKLLIK